VAVAESGAAPKIASIEMTAKQQRFEIDAAKEPASVELDPHTWVLVDARLARK